MITYQVVEAAEPEKLAERVNGLLEKGWKLQGGVSVTAAGDDFYLYAQAMTFGD